MDSNDQKIITSEAEEVKHEHERESDQVSLMLFVVCCISIVRRVCLLFRVR